jgi:hypothetical protein
MAMTATATRPRRPEPQTGGIAVRRDWPDGTHDLVHFGTSLAALDGYLDKMVPYWQQARRWPKHVVVEVSAADFDAHARLCTSGSCPSMMDRCGAEHWVGT